MAILLQQNQVAIFKSSLFTSVTSSFKLFIDFIATLAQVVATLAQAVATLVLMDQLWPSWTSSGPHGPALAFMDQLWPSWTSSGPHGPALAGPDGTTLARMELFLPAGTVQVRMEISVGFWNSALWLGWSYSGLAGATLGLAGASQTAAPKLDKC
jgi:hypothetical protein